MFRAILLALASAFFASPADAGRVTVFAAASLAGPLDEISQSFSSETGHEVSISYAASSVLARQIARGAPADIFISASSDWMDVLTAEGHVLGETRHALVGNRLAVIAPANAPPLARLADLPEQLGNDRLAVALTESVPAGVYAKSALESAGLWESLAPRLAETDNVRAALALVASGAVPLGIVYASDAAMEPRVRVLLEVPEEIHPPIVYPAAIVSGADRDEVRALMTALLDPDADDIFLGAGFAPLPVE